MSGASEEGFSGGGGGRAGPSRTLGFWSATALVVASMLGTGVFTTSGFLLADLGSPFWVLLAWVLGGGIALLGSMSYGALARHLPESGGEYLFLSRTLHPTAGYVAGWISLLVGFSAPLAAAAQAFGEYTAEWFPAVPPPVTGSLLILTAIAVHGWDVRRGAWIQNLAVGVKLTLLALVLGPGLGRMTVASLPAPGTLAIPTLAMALVWVSFSYAGWNAVIYVGGEVARPERTIPRALLAGTLLVTGLYVAIQAVLLFAVPGELLVGKLEVARIAARHLGGERWADGITLLVALALVTSVSALVMTGPRVYARIAADGYLPGWLAATSGPPRRAILFQGILALGMLWTASYQALLSFIGFTLGLSTAATVWGLMRVRVRLGKALPVPGWPWVPLGFVVAVLGMSGLSALRAPWPSLAGLMVLGLGWVAGEWQRTRRERGAGLPGGTASASTRLR